MSVRRSGILALAVVLAAGCSKSVSQRAPAQKVYLAAFDPTTATVPLPNDLALQAAPTLPAGVTRELLFTYIDGGGWPGDQSIAIPIRTIAYDAANNRYVPSSEPAPGIDPTTVNARTIAIVRVSDSPPTVLEPQVLAYAPDPANPAIGVLRIRPVEGLAVGRYAVALRGGGAGVKTSDGQPIGPDQAIALLAPDKDLTIPENQPTGGLQPAQVAQLEQLRFLFDKGLDWAPVPSLPTCQAALGAAITVSPGGSCWLPPLPPGTVSSGVTAAFQAVDLVFPHDQLASIQTFEIAGPAVVADTAAGVIPFPSDFMLDPQTGKVRNLPSLGAAAQGLALLDGFSTTGLMLIPLSAPALASTITPQNVLVYDLSSGIRKLTAFGAGTPADYFLEPPQLVRSVGSIEVTTAIGLQPGVPVVSGSSLLGVLPPLEPKTPYLVVVTDRVTDVAGHPLVRGTLADLLLTVSTPLFDGTHSSVPGVSDADAAALQALRDKLRTDLLPNIVGDTGGTEHVVMAYTVHTQDVTTDTASMPAVPYTVEQAKGAAFFTTSTPTELSLSALGLSPLPDVKKFLSTTVVSLDILSAQTGAIDTATLAPSGWDAAKHQIPVLVAVPKVACAAAGCPLVVFHHGIFGSRYQMIAVADELAAKGFVVAATDAPFHGDRAFCQKDGDCNGGTCTLDAANQKAPGACTGGSGLAFDGTRLTTVASGNYFISSNFFRIRDAIREDLLDHSALVLAVTRGGSEPLAQALAAEGVTVDEHSVYFAGMSLGGMIGTSLVATNPRVSRVGLDVAGATLVDIVTQGPAFSSEITPLFSQLIPGFTPEKVDPGNAAYDPVIAQQYAQTLIVAKWILDPVEALNYAAAVTSKSAANADLRGALGSLGLAVSSASVYGQLVEQDPVVLNPFSALLYGEAGIHTTEFLSAALPSDQRHGVLLAPTAAGAKVRGALANFLAAPGTTPPATVDLDSP
jgi:pimeloyl-ACP methyl ester carboxylesterase